MLSNLFSTTILKKGFQSLSDNSIVLNMFLVSLILHLPTVPSRSFGEARPDRQAIFVQHVVHL
jgi:hypothetical protein